MESLSSFPFTNLNSNTTAVHLDPSAPASDYATLTWTNVAIGLAFILFDVGVSTILRLGIGISLLVAALRCIGQLAVVATVLQGVFEHKNPWSVAGIAFVLNLLGTIETVVNKAARRFDYMFPAVLSAMLGSTIPIAIIGSRFAMSVEPFWTPIQFIPLVGMLCGATISGMIVALNYVLSEIQQNRDKVETYLAFGASRFEACRPIAIQALKLALTPPINSMSVLGIIAIPGMMTGAILGGSSVHQAAKLQMIIMFMITASTTLASIFVTVAAVVICVDAEHRVRSERIVTNETGVGFGWLWTWIWNKNGNGEGSAVDHGQNRKKGWMHSVRSLKGLIRWHRAEDPHAEQSSGPDERTRLLA